MKDDIVIVTGGFDPIHSGHIEYIKDASQYGRVVIGLNSDEWLTRKKGSPFMSFEERNSILSNIKNVLCVIPFDDSDNSACDAIEQVKKLFPKNKIIFANGGDRKEGNIPEMDRYKDDPNVEFIFGVGGVDKKNSSSTILQNWKYEKTNRTWGHYFNFYKSQEADVKVKKLVLEPNQAISMQRHFSRSELWFVESGIGLIQTRENDRNVDITELRKQDFFKIPVNSWHKLTNTHDKEPLIIIEIQYGEYCDESDIERL
jgi:D-beta-D-heptose 7-phosphate kinase/D-beta-D-heptose 1-phosphate adenosyltransferase